MKKSHLVAALLLSVAQPAIAAAAAAPVTPFDNAVGAAKAAMMSDPGVALVSARRAGTLAGTTADAPMAVATAQWLESEALTRLNHPEQAVKLIDTALAFVAAQRPNTKLHGDLLRSRASVAVQSEKIQLGLASLLKAHAIYKGLGEKRSQAMVLQNLGSIYSAARDYPRALDYYAQANDTYSEDPALVLAAHNNRGNIFKETGDFTAAEKEFRAALKLAEGMDSPLLRARVQTNIGEALLLQGKPAQADKLAAGALLAATGDAVEWKPFLWGVRGWAAHQQGDHARAVQFFEQTFKGVDLKKSNAFFRNFHEVARFAYEALDRDREALQHLAAYKRLDDQAREVTASTMSALMSARFDAANQRARIGELKAQKAQSEQRLRNTVTLAITGVLAALSVAIAVLFAFAASRRSRREISAANAQLTYAARHDALTGLANRAYFRERVVHALSLDAHCAVVLIDLDRFKAVNDSFGHNAGDELLRQVSRRIEAAVDSNALPARLGGDEFAVLVTANTARIDSFAAKIVEDLGMPYALAEGTANIGASIGIAIAPADGGTVDTLTRGADLALYRAKAAGRGRHVRYEPWMQAEADDRRALEDDLRMALANDELTLAYQPIVDAGSNQVLAYEALLRWQHPTRGLVSPAVFVPIAEEARLINEIGSWVLRTACQAATAWEDHVKVAVNLSALQLEAEGLAGTIIHALAQSGLPAERLELEMTESVFLRQGPRTEQMLDRLRTIGVSLALDDFGTGYSSLGYLQRATFSKIKIDRSFVQSATNGCPESIAIIKAIVALAGSLKMETTAEGVERSEETDMMRSLGCSQLQGFLFGMPEDSKPAITAGAPVEVLEPVRKPRRKRAA